MMTERAPGDPTGPAGPPGSSEPAGPADDPVRRIVRVRGQVQGVGFRMSAASQAARLGVSGTVRNLWDASVEADVEGPAEAVEQMISWLREGPPSAQVSGIDVRTENPRGAEAFRITG